MNLYAHLAHTLNIRACYTAMEYITKNSSLHSLEISIRASMLHDGEQIKQALGWMCMSSIASVDDNRAYNLRSIFSCTLGLVAHYYSIHTHSLHGVESIPEALALYYAAGASSNVDNIRTKVFSCQLKG